MACKVYERVGHYWRKWWTVKKYENLWGNKWFVNQNLEFTRNFPSENQNIFRCMIIGSQSFCHVDWGCIWIKSSWEEKYL